MASVTGLIAADIRLNATAAAMTGAATAAMVPMISFVAGLRLLKPCDKLTTNAEILSKVGAIAQLPPAPDTYLAISKALSDPNVGAAQVEDSHRPHPADHHHHCQRQFEHLRTPQSRHPQAAGRSDEASISPRSGAGLDEAV